MKKYSLFLAIVLAISAFSITLNSSTDDYQFVPIAIQGLSMCALTSSGAVRCVGSQTLRNFADLSKGVVAIVSGWAYTCALISSGEVKCWGDNRKGQLCFPFPDTSQDKPVHSGDDFKAITAGLEHTCGITKSNKVLCWGDNDKGQIGSDRPHTLIDKVEIAGLKNDIKSISAGTKHTCALNYSGGIKCWGFNESGQLGDGTNNNSSIPVDVKGLTQGIKAISAGDIFNCALTSNGGVKCWGNNHSGQLGDGTTVERRIPVLVKGLEKGISSISAGSDHACALTLNGGVKCWGGNMMFEIGDGTTVERHIPVDVVGLSSGVKFIKAANFLTCVLTNTNQIKCWGRAIGGEGIPGWTPKAELEDENRKSHKIPYEVKF